MRSTLVYGCVAWSERRYCSRRILQRTPPELHAGQLIQKGLRLVGHVSTTFPDSEPPIVHNGEIDDAVGGIGDVGSSRPLLIPSVSINYNQCVDLQNSHHPTAYQKSTDC